jgi:hypothetical protein
MLAIAVTQAGADDDPTSRETLRGLIGVRVVVAQLDPAVQRLGLSMPQVQTDVELRLRAAGIRQRRGDSRRSACPDAA